MKKSYLIAAAALAIAGTAGAQTVGNPKTGIKDENGNDYYFVAYDMDKGEFIHELPEIDQTFVFAIDFTGTGLEDKMKTLPEPNRANITSRPTSAATVPTASVRTTAGVRSPRST